MSGLAQFRHDLNAWFTSLGAGTVGPEFYDLIKSIGEAKSKAEEAATIEREVRLLRETIGKPENDKKMREMLVRALYCEMLGYPVPFAYIHALNMTQKPKLIDKRVGYLFVALCLHENHELMMLVINSFRRDLASTNILEISSALTCMSWLINAETVPAVIEVVKTKITHPSELVRKKVIMVIHRCLQRLPDIISEVNDTLRRALCDRDISVMAASLHCFLYLLKAASEGHDGLPNFRDLVPSFVGILKQVAEHKLDKDYEYHKTPAPWIQVALLKILAFLGKDSQQTSDNMYEVINEAMKRVNNTNTSSGYSVMYEAVRTICTIYPNKFLLDHAAEAISSFVTSPNNNLKYMGLVLLAQIVQINPSYAVQHQMHVINCLEDPDDSIQRKTLNLLYQMTNPKNVTIVAEKLLEHLKKSTDTYLRTELVSKLTSLTERYSVNNQWFIKTMNKVFLLGGELVANEVAFNLMRLIAEGTGGGSDEADTSLRLYAVRSYCDLLQQPVLPDILEKLAAWTLGEYGYLLEDDDKVIDLLGDLMERPHKASEVRNWVATALAKMTKTAGVYRSDVADLLLKYASSDNLELSRRCQEYNALLSMLATDGRVAAVLDSVLPVDASCEDIDVEAMLGPVTYQLAQEAIANGEPEYVPRNSRNSFSSQLSPTPSKKKDSKLRFKYDEPPPQLRQQHQQIFTSNESILRQASATSLASQPGQILPTPQPTAAPEKPAASVLAAAGPWSRTGFGTGLRQPPKPTAQLPSASPASSFVSTSPTSTNIKSELLPGTSHSPTSTTTSGPSSNSSGQFRSPINAPAAPTAYYEHQKMTAMYKASTTSSPTSTTTASPYAPESSKSQQLASALFQGMGGADSPALRTTGGNRGSATRTTPNRGTAGSPTPATGMTRSGSAPRVAATPAPLTGSLLGTDSPDVPSTPVFDLLGGLDLSSGTASPPPSSSRPAVDLLLGFDMDSQPKASGSSDLLSLPLSPSTPQAPSVGFSTPLSPLAFTPMTATTRCLLNQLSGSDPDNFDISNLQKTDLIVQNIDGKPRSNPSNQTVVKDSHLAVSQFRVWKEEEIAVCLFHSNRSTTTLTNIQTELSLPTGLSASVETDETVSYKNNTVTISSLGPKVTALVVVLVKNAGQLSYTSALQCIVKYAVSTQPKNYKFRVPFELVDFIRPSVGITVDKFGALWNAHKFETKNKLSSGAADSVEQIKTKLASFNISTIEIIKMEVIAAARFIAAPGAEQQLLLVHLKFEPASKALDVTVKTKDKLLTELATRFFTIALAGK